MEAFVEGYGQYGFAVCDGPELEPGFEKIAVYAEGREPLHVARQLLDGRWTSKLGRQWEDIEHINLEDVVKDGYGEPVLFLRRPYAQ